MSDFVSAVALIVSIASLVVAYRRPEAPVTKLRQKLIDAIDQKRGAEIIWPNHVKEAFDEGKVQNITDILA